MKKSRLEWKVGLFVIIALVFFGVLILKFSKSASLFESTYQVLLETKNVGGILDGAPVLLRGVQIGRVLSRELQEGGQSVIIRLSIQDRYKIHKDAEFSIKQAGFLGDRFIDVLPTQNKEAVLQPGDKVQTGDPFDIQEVAKSAVALLERVDATAKTLNDAVTRIDRTLFAEQTLTNLTVSVSNFRVISEQAMQTLEGIDQFVSTNTHPLSSSVSNLVVFSEQLNSAAGELRQIVSTNRTEVNSIVKNIASASDQLNLLARELQDGKGLAGSILKDEQLRQNFFNTMSNMSTLSSNMNKYGLLYKPRTPRPATPPVYSGRNPFR